MILGWCPFRIVFRMPLLKIMRIEKRRLESKKKIFSKTVQQIHRKLSLNGLKVIFHQYFMILPANKQWFGNPHALRHLCILCKNGPLRLLLVRPSATSGVSICLKDILNSVMFVPVVFLLLLQKSWKDIDVKLGDQSFYVLMRKEESWIVLIKTDFALA